MYFLFSLSCLELQHLSGPLILGRRVVCQFQADRMFPLLLTFAWPAKLMGRQRGEMMGRAPISFLKHQPEESVQRPGPPNLGKELLPSGILEDVSAQSTTVLSSIPAWPIELREGRNSAEGCV